MAESTSGTATANHASGQQQWGPGSQTSGASQAAGTPQAGHPNAPPPPYASHQGATAPLRIDNESIQAMHKSLKLVQKLRSAVNLTFQRLADGVKRETPAVDASTSTAVGAEAQTLEASSVSNGEKEKAFVEEMKKDLKQIGDTMSEVEHHVNLIQDQAPQHHYNRTASFLLPLDSVNVGDKHKLWTQLYHSHRWLDKVHEFSSVSCTVLSQNNTRRSTSASSSSSNQRESGPQAAKRLKVKGPTAQQVSASPAAIDQFVADLSRNFKNTMTIKLSRPLGNPALLNITLARTLKVYVILRGFIIEWVNVLGFCELQAHDFELGVGDQEASLDAVWTKSRHQVFRRISDHAAAAMIHFYLPNNPELALKSFLMWLNSYEKLFYDPCFACHKIIQSADGSVPVFRDLRTLKPYHDLCRP